MKQYKHIFDALVNGEQVEVNCPLLNSDRWLNLHPSDVLGKIQYGIDPKNFRIKPKTININGHEVPEPVREPLEYGQFYFIPIVDYEDSTSQISWDGGLYDRRNLSRGLIHLTAEAAEAHAKALLSFTQLPEASKSA